MTIGTKLRQFREKKRLSQQEVADHLGVGQSTYSQWESDQSTLKVDHLIRLADFYAVEIIELLPLKKLTSPDEKKPVSSDMVSDYLISEILESKNELIRLLKEENDRLKSLIY